MPTPRNNEALWQQLCAEYRAEAEAMNKICMVIERPEDDQDQGE
jgi:hypothetical protein